MNLQKMFTIATGGAVEGAVGDLNNACRRMQNLANALILGEKASRQFSASDYAEVQEMQLAYDDSSENIDDVIAEATDGSATKTPKKKR